MRIHKNDVLVDVYNLTDTPNAEGFMTRTVTKLLSDYEADIQPIGGNINFQSYGIDAVASNSRIMFYDDPILLRGQIILSGGVTYMIKGIKDWYTHSEAIIEPYEVTLP